VRVWDLATGNERFKLDPPKRDRWEIGPDGSFAIAETDGKSFVVQNLYAQKELHLPVDAGEELLSSVVTADGRMMVTSTYVGDPFTPKVTLKVWDLASVTVLPGSQAPRS
jgi:hypothetical protein